MTFEIGNIHRPSVRILAGDGAAVRLIAGVGTSPGASDVKSELSKAKAAVEAGADILIEESILEPEGAMLRSALLEEVLAPLSTVPLFEVSATAVKSGGSPSAFRPRDVLATIERQARQGIDVMTLHAAFDRHLSRAVNHSKRLIPLGSRSGAILTAYMAQSGQDNPIRLHYEEILDILSAEHVTLSLGAALRPASVCDGLDDLFYGELVAQRELCSVARDKGVNVMVEAAGHVRLDQISAYVAITKGIVGDAPLRSLGPTVCDVGAGFDHITGAIGAAVAALCGCEFITCTTRAEHIGLPRIDDIKEAVAAFRIAIYAGVAARSNNFSRDAEVSSARGAGTCNRDAAISRCLYPDIARSLRTEISGTAPGGCSMCGDYCALRMMRRATLPSED